MSLRPFLLQSGFAASKASFVPVGAMLGVNLIDRQSEDAKQLNEWYTGPTLIDCLGKDLIINTPGSISYGLKISWNPLQEVTPARSGYLSPIFSRHRAHQVYTSQVVSPLVSSKSEKRCA